jgi:hypothetical protein
VIDSGRGAAQQATHPLVAAPRAAALLASMMSIAPPAMVM